MDRTAGRLAAIAALLSLAVAGCGEGGMTGPAEADADARKECAGAARTAKELVASLPRGWQGTPVDQAVIDEATSDETRSIVDRLSARAVNRRGELVGLVMVYEFKRPAGVAGFYSGFKEKAEDEGEEIQLAGGRRGRMFRLENGVTGVAGTTGPCAATTVFGSAPEITQELATELALEPPS